LADPEADAADDLLRSEIESAAEESRALADELAAMLGRLGIENDRENAVEAAVIGDSNKVENALKDMLDKIEKLAEVSEDSNTDVLIGSIEQKREEEKELKSTVEQLEIIAKQIEEVSSVKDIETIDDMAELLQSVSDKIESKIETGVEEVQKDSKGGKASSSTALELNGIEEMIRTLEEVTDNLRGFENNGGLISDYEGSELSDNVFTNQAKSMDSKKKLKSSNLNDSKLNDSSHLEQSNTRNMQNRNGKSLSKDLESEKVVKTSYSSKSKDEELETTGEKERGPKELEEDEEPAEKCTEKEASNRVRVCVPKFNTVDNTIQLYSGVVREERHCYDVTKTICEESSQIVSKEVCVYSYKQKTVVAPAQMTQVMFERRQEKLEVTRCEKGKSIGTGYKEKEVEVCKQAYEEFTYRLPAIIDNVDDFLDLNIPEPALSCQVYKYDIPEVTCQDVTTRECSEVAHVDPLAVTEYLETVELDYKGRCEQRNLEQTQQVCTKEIKTARKNPGYRG